MKMKAAALLVLTLASTSVLAHPQASGGLLHGFVHPFTGADHVAAMLIVGLWAARRRGASRLVLPLAFLGSMLAGALIAALDLRLPAVEPIAAVSVLVFAAALVAALRIPLSASAALVSVFALFHGYTHINGTAFIGGLLAGTALLLALGFAIGLAIAARRPGFA
jgi:urease accessory protein